MSLRRSEQTNELVAAFSQLDKAIGLRFIRYNSPIHFNELNKVVRPRIRVKNIATCKRLWPEAWNVWELEDDLLIDVFLAGDEFDNDQRIPLRSRFIDNMDKRMLEFKSRLHDLTDEQFVSLLEANRKSWFDEAKPWLAKAGLVATNNNQIKRTDTLLDLSKSIIKANSNQARGIVKHQTVGSKKELKQMNSSILERLRAKDKQRLLDAAKMEEEKAAKAKELMRSQFQKIYQIVYEQRHSKAITFNKLRQLYEDSNNGSSPSKFAQTVTEMVKEVNGLKLETVGQVQIIQIGSLDFQNDLSQISRLKSTGPC